MLKNIRNGKEKQVLINKILTVDDWGENLIGRNIKLAYLFIKT